MEEGEKREEKKEEEEEEVVVVEYLESVIFLHRSHPLQILFFSVLFCTEEGHNAKMWRFPRFWGF